MEKEFSEFIERGAQAVAAESGVSSWRNVPEDDEYGGRAYWRRLFRAAVAFMDGPTEGMGLLALAVRNMGATPADKPGLWNVPGYPELTGEQLVAIAMNAFARA